MTLGSKPRGLPFTHLYPEKFCYWLMASVMLLMAPYADTPQVGKIIVLMVAIHMMNVKHTNVLVVSTIHT